MAHVLDQSKHLQEEKERNVLFRYKAKCILFTLQHIDPIVVECLKKVAFMISTFILLQKMFLEVIKNFLATV